MYLKIRSIKSDQQGFSVRLDELVLTTVFQPIVHRETNVPYGYEALIRCKDKQGNIVSPVELFNGRLPNISMIKLDLVSATLHLINYRQYKDNLQAKVFVNMNPISMEYLDQHQSVWKLMNQCVRKFSKSQSEYDPSNVVIEVVEHELDNSSRFARQLTRLKDQGFLLAIDDFGVGASDVDRIKKVEPDIVKLDRSFLPQFKSQRPKQQRSLLHEVRQLKHTLVVEGIESKTDTEFANALGAKLMQGYYFGRPNRIPHYQGSVY